MITYLKRLVEERNSLTGLMQSMSERAASEDRDLTEHERGTMASQQSRCAELDAQIAEHKAQAESQRAWANLSSTLEALESERESREPVLHGEVVTRDAGPQSWGAAILNSEALRAYDGHGSSGRIELPNIFERAAIDTGTVPVPPFIFSPTQWTMTTPLLDAVGKQTVTTGSVEWIDWGGAYPLAGVVAEGAVKPEATLAPTVETKSLLTWAHYKAITRQALEDIPRIQSIVETQLRGGILRKMEADTAAALSGGTYTEASGADMLTAVRVAIADVQAAGYASQLSVLMNPADAATMDLDIMQLASVLPTQQSSVFGVRVITAGAVAAGTAYVGDFGAGITLFTRGGTSVYLTDSHADFFIRNTFVVLAEARGLPVVTEPLAIVKATVKPAAPEASGTGGTK